MEVLETNEKPAEPVEKTVEEQKKEIFNEAAKAIGRAEDRVAEKTAVETKPNSEPLSEKLEADVERHVESSNALKNADAGAGDRFSYVADDLAGKRIVEVTKEEKSAFLESVVTGSRYRATSSIFGGKVLLEFRSRSAVESEAIDAFLRYRGTHKIIQSGVAYADAMRFCILAAGVEAVNDNHFPTITEAAKNREGLFYVEKESGTEEPAWTWLFDKWRDMPESVVAAILNAYFSFEAKYWKMIEKSSDENFWNPDGSTGE